MARIESLEELREAIRKTITSDTAFGLLNARLLILVGVNLRAISPRQNHDAALVKRAVDALSRMGIRLELNSK